MQLPHPSHPWLSPRRLLLASVVVAVITIAMKTAAWYVTDSVGLLSDALESFVNLASALFAFAMVTIAQQPADANHPYGHHKAEYFSAGFEGFLIVGVSIGIAWAALHRLFDPQPLERVGWGVVLSAISSAFNGALAWVMLRSAREHRSLALEADARHLITDVWTSAGVIVGLIGAAITGWLWLDVVAALVVAVNILREGVALVWQSSQGLMDEAAEPEVQARIAQELTRFTQSHPEGVLRFDHLVTRRAGQRHFANLHLHVPSHWTLGIAAHLRGDAERALMTAVPGLRVSIELLPHDMEAHLDDHPSTNVAVRPTSKNQASSA